MSAADKLTGSLEDYLETIYELIRDKKVARVKDIAKVRGVMPGSVSPAMKRLSEMGLISYVRRDHIDLTQRGMKQARRIYARHQVLTWLFRDVLGLTDKEAQKNACTMEHSLTPKAMDRLVQFYEFVGSLPEGKDIKEAFRDGGVAVGRAAVGGCNCTVNRGKKERAVSDLAPGEIGKVSHVRGKGAVRQRLLNMGILPDVSVEVLRSARAGEPVQVKVQGFNLSLNRAEANAIMVVDGT